jgi:hypothetical protein
LEFFISRTMGTWVLIDTVAYGLRKMAPAALLPEAKAEGEPLEPVEAEEAEESVDIRGGEEEVRRFVDENGAAAGGETIRRNWIEGREPMGIGVGRREESRSWRTGNGGFVR